MKNFILAALTAPLLVTACNPAPETTEAEVTNRNNQQVIIGAEGADLDACPAIATPSERVVLRAGPDDGAFDLGELTPGDNLFICGFADSGAWLSIVRDEANKECGVSTPVSEPQVYSGPCLSGWLKADEITPLAG